MKRVTVLAALVALSGAFVLAQQPPAPAPAGAAFARPAPYGVPDEPRTFGSLGGPIRVSAFVKNVAAPWSIAFLPNGDMLFTEKAGRLRIVRNGVLDPAPISGTPAQIWTQGQAGLLEISLHPKFAENRVVYLTYSKPGEGERAKQNTTALMRARLEGNALVDGKDIFVAEAWREANQHFGSRIAWGRDGMLYMTIGERNERNRAQDTMQHAGKVLRLRDDGTAPPDNPFVGRQGFRPEIYSYGHRNSQSLAFHPETGELWEAEHGPQGGDELNLIKPGLNYGWPIATYGREYNGDFINAPYKDGIEMPATVWVPSIATSGMVIYSGDKFPSWKGNIFVGGLAGQQLHRVVFAKGGVQGRETLLSELRLRIRDVRQGPDGFLYLAVDATPNGAILKLEPGAAPTNTSAQQ
jgi:glucose/arabinose dehydrogenase